MTKIISCSPKQRSVGQWPSVCTRLRGAPCPNNPTTVHRQSRITSAIMDSSMSYVKYVVYMYSQSCWAKHLSLSIPDKLEDTCVDTSAWQQNSSSLAEHGSMLFYCCQPFMHIHKPQDTAILCTHTHTQSTGPLIISNPVLLLAPLSSLMCFWPKVDFAVSVFTSVWCRGCMPWRLNQKDRGLEGMSALLNSAGIHTCMFTPGKQKQDSVSLKLSSTCIKMQTSQSFYNKNVTILDNWH